MKKTLIIAVSLLTYVLFANVVWAEEAKLSNEDFEMLAKAGRILDSKFVVAVANGSCPEFPQEQKNLLKLHFGQMVEYDELREWLTMANIYGRVKYISKKEAELVYLGNDNGVGRLMVVRSHQKLIVQIFSNGHIACEKSENK